MLNQYRSESLTFRVRLCHPIPLLSGGEQPMRQRYRLGPQLRLVHVLVGLP